jgi:hypothetical protein
MTSAICPQCFRVTETATGKCSTCTFPLDKDPADYAVCYGCNEWKLIAELTEDGDDAGAWYCEKCLDAREARRNNRRVSKYEARLIESERRYDAERDDKLTEQGGLS